MHDMATSALKMILVLSLFVIIYVEAQVDQQSFHLMTEALEWPSRMSVVYYDDLGGDVEEDDDGIGGSNTNRRSLHWRAVRHYISYGALSANRIPCPPRSGRSYYTHNCFKAKAPVNPYSRGCSCITHCRR